MAINGNVAILLTPEEHWKIIASFIIPAGVDILITLLMLYKLQDYSKKGSSQGTGKIIKRLMIFTIESNALTSLYCVIFVIIYLTKGGLYLLLIFSIGPIYAITLLVNLGSRSGTQHALHGSSSSHNAFTSHVGRFTNGSPVSNRYGANTYTPTKSINGNGLSKTPASGIQIQTERVIDVDIDHDAKNFAMVSLPVLNRGDSDESIKEKFEDFNFNHTLNYQA